MKTKSSTKNLGDSSKKTSNNHVNNSQSTGHTSNSSINKTNSNRVVDTPIGTNVQSNAHVPIQRRGSSKKLKFIIGGLLVAGLIAGGVYYYEKIYTPPILQTEETQTGRYALEQLQGCLNSGNLEDIGVVSGTSYLGLEINYANLNDIRLKFIKMITSNVKFQYPTVDATNKRGVVIDKNTGLPQQIPSDMTNGESVKVTMIDYSVLADKLEENRENIQKKYKEKGNNPKDYTYQDDMLDFMFQYILEMDTLPTKVVDIKIPLVSNGSGYAIQDDSVLDKELFSSDDFHKMCDKFGQIIEGWTETITHEEEVDNPEYAKYVAGRADGSIPASTPAPEQKIKNKREEPNTVEFVPEQTVPYDRIGAYYMQKEVEGCPLPIPLGDGTSEHPADFDTSIITKAKSNTGYNDIRIKLKSFWRGKDAIDYLIGFSEKNRGFDESSPIQLMAIEYEVTNLMDTPITVTDDMTLCDVNANKSSRTGTVYGLTEKVELQPHETKTLQSWGSSTELDRKYLMWGKSFDRENKNVWFLILAGDKTNKNGTLSNSNK